MALKVESIFTSERLRRGKSAIPGLLELQAMDFAYWRDDFMGDTLHGGYQSSAGSGASTAAISTGVVNGAILLDAGSTDDAYSDISLGLHFRGDLNAHVWWKLEVNAITSYKLEAGFTDVVSGTDTGAVNVKASNSFNATDAVVLCVDTDDDANMILKGVDSGTGATEIDLNADGRPVATTQMYLGVELRDGVAKGYVLDANGRLMDETAWMTSAVTSSVLLTPWCFVQNRSGTQRTATVDMVYAYQRRTSS